MRNKLLLLAAAGSLLFKTAFGQVYTADISKTQAPIVSGHLKLGTHTNAGRHTVDANSLYFTKDGKPWYPVMGEFHFSRYPKQRWEESILKMKAAGIDVIATYVFWIYHEEEEGKFNWQGNNDLRSFIQLCKKHNMLVVARIGPWCHGEVRNGAFPDWIVKRGNMRKNNPEYLASVQKLFNAIAGQTNGLYFKDGGPIIGAQIENEYRFNNPAGLEHIMTLKQMASKAGIDVPFYTATGWPGSNLKQTQLVPVWGGYPEAPWDKRTTKIPLSENYLFSLLRSDPGIGSDLLGKHQEDTTGYKGYLYPYATAEMGGGIQITYHRRPIIEADDVAAMAYVKIGAGANLMGYYMFHGGSNPVGKLSTLQESKATNYPNDYPIINYDFQAPIGQYGQIRPSYHAFKVIHSFLNDFGDRLVQYYPTFPNVKPSGAADSATLRFAVRSKGNSGFVFLSNYQRELKMKDQQGIQFDFKLPDNGNIKFPENAVNIPSGVQAILPFNMDIEGCNLRYATVQPLMKLSGTIPTYVFFAPKGIRPEYVFDKKLISTITPVQATLVTRKDSYLLNNIKEGTSCLITLKLKNGKQVKILTLTQQQALYSWKGNIKGTNYLLLSKQELTFAKASVKIQDLGNPNLSVAAYPSLQKLPGKLAYRQLPDGLFNRFYITLPAKKIAVTAKPVSNIDNYLNTGEQLPLDDRNSKNIEASPGPQYQTNLKPVNGAQYWELSVPATAANSILDIDYEGDTGSLYQNGKLVNDDFNFGKTMQTKLTQLKPGKFLLQVVPLTKERQIYFEDAVKRNIKPSVAALKVVKIIPTYEATISW
jgi:beta-galactosidase